MGCCDCKIFLETYFPKSNQTKLVSSVSGFLRTALEELFNVMGIGQIVMERSRVSIKSFINDFLCMSDEVRSSKNIVDLWHIEEKLADAIFEVFEEIVFLNVCLNDNSLENSVAKIDSDTDDDSSESSDASMNLAEDYSSSGESSSCSFEDL